MTTQLSPTELKNWIESQREFQLLDVREPWEHETASLPNSLLIPLRQIPARWGELDPKKTIVAYCHHGVRSLQAAHFLVSQGFEDVRNLTGGIDAYSCDADSEIPRY